MPPDINKSYFEFNIEDDKIRFSLAAVAGLFKSAYQIIEERKEDGKYKEYKDIFNLLSRVPLTKSNIESLVYCGALDTLAEKTVFPKTYEKIHTLKTKEKRTFIDFENAYVYKYETPIKKGVIIKEEESLVSKEGFNFNINQVKNDRNILLQYIFLIKELGIVEPNKSLLEIIDTSTKLNPKDFSYYKNKLIEKIYLEMCLSGHPLDPIAKKTDWESIEQKEVIAIIKDFRKITTKTGKDMAFVTIDCLEGQKELLLFSNNFDSNIGKLEINSIRKITLQTKYDPSRGYSHIIASIRAFKYPK